MLNITTLIGPYNRGSTRHTKKTICNEVVQGPVIRGTKNNPEN